jgi:hypothetical protein
MLLYTIYNHSTLISSVYLHWSSQIYNTGTITASLSYTLQILHINKVFSGRLLIILQLQTSHGYLQPKTDLLDCSHASVATTTHNS